MSNEPTKHDQSVPSPRASAYDAELEREIEAALGGMSVEDLENSSTPSRSGGNRGGRQTRRGTIIRVHSGDVFVEFGPRSQGVCPLSQFIAAGEEQAPPVGSERDFVVENIYSSLAANNMPLPPLPTDGRRIIGLGELQPDGATLRVLTEGDTEVGTVYDTDRWLLDLSDRPADVRLSVAVHLERRFQDPAGTESPSDPWIAVLERSLVPTPTVEGTKRGTCPEGGASFAYPASVLDYLYSQIFLSGVSVSGEVAPEDEEVLDTAAAEDGFDPCGVVAEVPTTCADDWDLDGVLDVDEPRPASFLEQVQVMQCTLNGGTIRPGDLLGPELFDLDERDEDEESSYDRSRNLGGRYAGSGEEAYLEADLIGGRQYVIVVGAGTEIGPYELRVQQTN